MKGYFIAQYVRYENMKQISSPPGQKRGWTKFWLGIYPELVWDSRGLRSHKVTFKSRFYKSQDHI